MNIVIGMLIFMGASSVLGLLGAMFAGTLTVFVSWASLLLGASAGLAAGFRCRFVTSGQQAPGYFDMAAILAFVLFCLRSFLWIYYKNGDSIYTLNGYHYADLHLHLGIIQNFLQGASFWPDNPIFVGDKLYYHFGIDFFTALFVKAGFPLERTLPLIGLGCGILTLFTLFWWGRGFAIAGFLFAGGFAGYLVFTTGKLDDYQIGLAWKSLVLTLFLPQRGFLFAIPAGLLILWSWKRRFLENKAGFPFWAEGFLWGVMPFFQIQTFLFLSAIFLIWVVFSRKIKGAVALYFTALGLAAPLMFSLTDGFKKSSLMWWKPGWMMGNEHPVIFFLWNFGLWPFLILLAGFFIVRRGDFSSRVQFFSSFGIFLVFMFVMCAPWEWDNIKIFLWCYLIFIPLVDRWVLQEIPVYYRAVLIVLLCLSGFVCVVGALSKEHQGTALGKRVDWEGACEAIKHIDHSERFATAQEAYHPVFQCGYMLVAGFAGNLNSPFSVNAQPVEFRLNRLMMGEFDWRQMAKELNVRYLFWGKQEERIFKNSNRPWELYSHKVAEGKWGKFYDLQKSSTLSLNESNSKSKNIAMEFYDNAECQGNPLKTENVSRPDFEWESEKKPFKEPACMTFSGKIYIEKSGETTFYLASDDGSKLSIDQEVIVDNWGVHAVRVRKKTIFLKEGWHDFKIQYNDIGGGATLRFWWKRAGDSESLIPQEAFEFRKDR